MLSLSRLYPQPILVHVHCSAGHSSAQVRARLTCTLRERACACVLFVESAEQYTHLPLAAACACT
eukprot:scaffold7474_cov113-Isochrysis_galbana.AAC.9